MAASLLGRNAVTPIAGLQTFVYKTTAARPLFLYSLQPTIVTSGVHPAIVFFFGGGWVNGSTDQFADQARYFAARGFVAVLADYRVQRKDNSTPFDSVRDARSAMRWLHEHANELHVDGQRIVASGGSAGGHLAGATAILSGIDDPSDDLNVSASPAALVLFNPVVDTTDRIRSPANWTARKGAVAHSSPFAQFTSDDPLPRNRRSHGSFSNAVEFTRIAKTYGADCQLVSFAGEDHGFFNSPNFRKTVTSGVYQKILEDVEVFFEKHGLEAGTRR